MMQRLRLACFIFMFYEEKRKKKKEEQNINQGGLQNNIRRYDMTSIEIKVAYNTIQYNIQINLIQMLIQMLNIEILLDIQFGGSFATSIRSMMQGRLTYSIFTYLRWSTKGKNIFKVQLLKFLIEVNVAYNIAYQQSVIFKKLQFKCQFYKFWIISSLLVKSVMQEILAYSIYMFYGNLNEGKKKY
eukprot:TRINITY_DN44536_c0_g1_i12.p2 TRINITY_DN44536_c0_g1~~TRINITY_DN44536_c0_g1_i12.p2  ORF type:complete len:186 (-),score=2.07 TRINITY_DN44536_c0_g1_i12:340-897(-)